MLVVISVLALAASGVAFWQRQIAQQQRNDALSRAAATQIITVVNTDPGLVARLALASYRVAPTLEARSAVLSSSALPRVTSLPGHRGSITALATVPGRPIVATAGADGTARLWDPTRHRELASLRGHKGVVNALAFSPDGTVLASGSVDHTARLWTAAGSVGQPLIHRSGVETVVFGADGQTLVTGSDDRVVNLFDLVRGQVLLTFPQPETVHAVAVTADGEQLLTGSANGMLRVWSLTGPVLPGAVPATSVAFSPDGRVLATTGAAEGAIQLWDSKDPRKLRPLGPPVVQHAGPVTAMAFSPDGTILATGSTDTTIRLWGPQHPGTRPPAWRAAARAPRSGHHAGFQRRGVPARQRINRRRGALGRARA